MSEKDGAGQAPEDERVGGVKVGDEFARDRLDLDADVHSRSVSLVLYSDLITHPFELFAVEHGLLVDLFLEVVEVFAARAVPGTAVVVLCVEHRLQLLLLLHSLLLKAFFLLDDPRTLVLIIVLIVLHQNDHFSYPRPLYQYQN